jgi:hypothetical protein
MNTGLEEINNLYLSVQEYMDAPMEYLLGLPEDDYTEYQEKRKAASAIYEVALRKFEIIVPSLTIAEIIEAYEKGSDLLRANLSGYIFSHFDEAYIPLITRSIREDHPHAYRLLGALCYNLPHNQVKPIVLDALNSAVRLTKETALGFVKDMEVIEAIPKVRELLKDPTPNLAEFAQEVLTILKRKTNRQ